MASKSTMKKRVSRSITKRQTRYQEDLKARYLNYVNLILPPRRDKKLGKTYVERTELIRSSQRRTDTLYSPYSKTVLRKRRNQTLVPPGRTLRRSPLLGLKSRTTPARNPCTKRDVRKSVLFIKKLIGHAGSSPGRNNTYKRTTESQYSCK